MTEKRRLPLIDETAPEPEDPTWYLQRMYEQTAEPGDGAGALPEGHDGGVRV